MPEMPKPEVQSVLEIHLKKEQDAIIRKTVFQKCLRKDAGVLLYHFMGTGKTLTALGVAANFASIVDRVIVVCPKVIKFVWQNEMLKWNPPIRPKILSYEEFIISDDDNANDCVIVDEVQNALGKSKVLYKLSQARVRLALSGTPADNVEGFLMLTRAVAPTMFPATEKETLKELTKINPLISGIKVLVHYTPNILYYLGPLAFLKLQNVVQFIRPEMIVPGFFVFIFMCFFEYLPKAASWDIPAIADLVKNSVSYIGDPADMGDLGFAKKKLTPVVLPLTVRQLQLFDDWVLQIIDPKILVDLGIVDDASELPFMTANGRSNIGTILDRGRGMGMIGKTAPKKKKLAKYLKQPVKTMVYSNFKGQVGIEGVKGILNKLGKAYVEVSSEKSSEENARAITKYNSNAVQVMLNYNVNEGMSLKETRRVLFVEPPMSGPIFSQVVARARRTDSHSHLPAEERKVEVVVLVGHFGPTRDLQKKVQSTIGFLTNVSYSQSGSTRALKEFAVGADSHEEAGAAVHKEAELSIGAHPYTRQAGLTYALMLAQALVAPRNSLRNVMRFLKNVRGSKAAERAELTLGKGGVVFDTSRGTPETMAWERIRGGLKDMDALTALLKKDNILSKPIIGKHECDSKCTIWPLSRGEDSCTKRVLEK